MAVEKQQRKRKAERKWKANEETPSHKNKPRFNRDKRRKLISG